MELSEKQSDEILTDLAQYVLEQGGTITSEKLGPFYARYPTYRALVKNMRSFCEDHPDRISIGAGSGPHYSLKASDSNEDKVLVMLQTFIQKHNGTIALTDLADFSFKHPACGKAILSGGRSLIQFLQQHSNIFRLEGTSVKVTSFTPALQTSADQTAAELALFLETKGGSMLASQLHEYYALNPTRKQVIDKVPAFCTAHPGLLAYTHNKVGGKLFLPAHCCKFLRKCCEHTSDHQGLLHSGVPDGAVHCQHGPQCSFGHWAGIVAQAKASPKGKGKGKVKGKQAETAISPDTVAATLALYANKMGGSVAGSKISGYYKIYPAHKAFISSVKSFCSRYKGLFAFETDASSGKLCLASYCCHFLRGACNHQKDHQSRQHIKPPCSLVVCHLRAECPHGHWKKIQKAAAALPQEGVVKNAASEEIDVPVSKIRWSHDSIRVVFQDCSLVAKMLKELLEGTLLAHQIPQIDVLEVDDMFFASSGNRRLWVLKEFERLRNSEVKVKVKKKSGKLPKKSPKYSTTNNGESVTFFSQKRDDNFPSMSFALAAINPSTAPSKWDVELGHEIRSCDGLPLWKIQRMSDLTVWQVPPPQQDLLDYLRGKPYLFVVTQGAVDEVVTLTGCVDALKLLGFDADASVKISSLESLEAVEEERSELLQDPDAEVSQSGEKEEQEAVGGYSASALEEALRSVCSPQPLSLFALPELVGVPNNADTCGDLLSFLRQRSNIFKISNSVFGHKVALIEGPDQPVEVAGAAGEEMVAENLPIGEGDCVINGSDARASDDAGEIPLWSRLSSVINDAGSDYGSTAGPASVGSRWGRAARQAEVESLPVPEEDVEEERLEVLERRYSDCEEVLSHRYGREPIQEVGELVEVTKHSSMGCAVVSLKDHQMRQAILAEGHQGIIDEVLVEIKAHKKKDTMEDVPTDLFVAWGRQAEKRSPLSEVEILKYFEGKCREISLQSTQLRADAPEWQPPDLAAWEAADGDAVAAEPELPTVAETPDLSSPKRCEDEDAGAFRMLLPSRLNREISRQVLEILQSSAHRLLYRVDSPMKVALRSGWLDGGKLPSIVLSQKDVEEVAKRLGWKETAGTVPIPGSPHRVTFGAASNRLSNVTVHIGRYLPGLWKKARDLLAAGSTIFVGPVGCGKTTILRDVAVNLSKDLQVLVVDFAGHLADISCDVGYLSGGNGEVDLIRQAISEYVPEVIVAEFSDTYAALQAGRVCDEAGVRLACSVRSNLQFLVESFVHAYTGSRQMRDLACVTFPFASAVLLSRETDEWSIYPNAPAVVCSRGRSRLPKCELHHAEISQPATGDFGDEDMPETSNLRGGESQDIHSAGAEIHEIPPECP